MSTSWARGWHLLGVVYQVQAHRTQRWQGRDKFSGYSMNRNTTFSTLLQKKLESSNQTKLIETSIVPTQGFNPTATYFSRSLFIGRLAGQKRHGSTKRARTLFRWNLGASHLLSQFFAVHSWRTTAIEASDNLQLHRILIKFLNSLLEKFRVQVTVLLCMGQVVE